MSFIYSLIARENDVILTEYSDFKGNFIQLIRIILQNRTKRQTECEIAYEEYNISFYSNKGITFLVMTDNSVETDVIFSFLHDIENRMYSVYHYEGIVKLNSYGMDSFSKELQKIIDHYNKKTRQNFYGEYINCNTISISTVEKKGIEDFLPRDKITKLIVVKEEKKNEEISPLNIEKKLNEEGRKPIFNSNKQKSDLLIGASITGFLILLYYII